MTSEQQLLVAVSALAGVVIFVFGLFMAKNKAQDALFALKNAAQDAELQECKDDRKALQAALLDQQKQMANIWQSLYKAGVKPVDIESNKL